MNALDFQRFNEGLETGTKLTGVTVVVQSVDGQYGPAVFLCHNVADERTLEAPVVAVLHLLVDDTVGLIFLCEAVSGLTTLHDLLVCYVTCALGVIHYMLADLAKCRLVVIELDYFAARS